MGEGLALESLTSTILQPMRQLGCHPTCSLARFNFTNRSIRRVDAYREGLSDQQAA